MANHNQVIENHSLALAFIGLLSLPFGVGCIVTSGGSSGPAAHCGSSSECRSGLSCTAGYCTGTGTTAPGEACADSVECTPGAICWNATCLGVGALRFSLAWNVDTDLDLHVQTPAGDEIYYGNTTAGGGTLDVDDCVGGSCLNPGGTHVENVFFLDTASPGTYTFWADNYSCDTATAFTIEVADGSDILATESETLPAACGESTHFTIVR